METNKFYHYKGNDYRSRNLIGDRPWEKPKEFDFVHQTVSRQKVQSLGMRLQKAYFSTMRSNKCYQSLSFRVGSEDMKFSQQEVCF